MREAKRERGGMTKAVFTLRARSDRRTTIVRHELIYEVQVREQKRTKTTIRMWTNAPMCDGAQMAIFGDIFASCISSEPRAAGFRPAS